jgi:hypothetical protein
MAVVSVNIETQGLDAMQAILAPAQFRKNVTAGLRYAARGAKLTSAKEIGQRYAIAAARIKQDIRTPVVGNSELRIGFGKRAPTVRAFGARPLARGGFSFTIFRGERETRRKGFILPVGEGVPVIRLKGQFTRTGKPKLATVYGPSIGGIFTGESRFGDTIRQATTQKLQTQFITGLQRELARIARGF